MMKARKNKSSGFFTRAQTPKMVKRQQAAIIDYYVKKRENSKKK
jgi:hypothetical protein